MYYKIEIQDKPGIFDAVAEGLKRGILDLGISSVNNVCFAQVYGVEGELSGEDVLRICKELLCDPVSQDYFINRKSPKAANESVIEVAYNPGVMDPVEESTLKGIRDLGIEGRVSVRTSKKYVIRARLSKLQLKAICEKLLYNKLIQHIVEITDNREQRTEDSGYSFKLIEVDLLRAADAKLLKISREGQLFLNIFEMHAIKAYFKKLGRNPTDCELETIAQTWSEHCYHKTFRGVIDYREQGTENRVRVRKINNLLKSTIMKVTRELKKPWCVSVFKDNSGVIRFDEKNNICFKVETHNHPSALEPFGGANTGIGGVIRDPMGTGLGAKPFLNTDVFCFGLPDYPLSKVPSGALHPKRIMKGVVSGVQDYGNKMGIPTVNGAVLFDEGFTGNPLVYCGTAGIMPKDKSFKKTSVGDLVVVVGGRTGRDGIHGATFSSGELTHESEVVSGGAVQIGNPIQEKKMLDTLLQARDRNLYTAITDCGAGGLSSAVGEMGAQLGVRVELDKVPLKYSGLSYMEIWISESQERMVLSVSPDKAKELLEVFSAENVEATVIGEFTGSGKLELYYQDNLVCSLDMGFLHNGIPKIEKKALYIQKKHREPKIKCRADLTGALIKLLSHYDICSKETIIRRYDHEVQGGSVIKPLAGIFNDGPSDAAIVKPVLDSKKGVVVSNGINFRYGFIDPYWMAASCIDEALRQVISVGGSLKEAAILDNFCWGNPDKPDRLGGLVRCAYGCYDAAKGFGVPFISGKDSLYNEYSVHGKSQSIPGTILISAIAVMEDAGRAVSMYFKEKGSLIYILGNTFEEMGGSHYYGLSGILGNSVPKVNARKAKDLFDALSRATDKELVLSMHDCSEGGLAVALAEMAFAGDLGAEVFLGSVPYQGRQKRNDFVLFSQSNSRFIAEVERPKQEEFERALKGLPFALIGCVSERKSLKVYGLDAELCVNADIKALKEAWKEPLKW
jgi:phosphoribosylformylglycinamidine synthase